MPLEDEGEELALHPYRKRKFFFELAELLGEEKPAIQQIKDVFTEAPKPNNNRAVNLPANTPATLFSQEVPQQWDTSSEDPEDDSLNVVQLGDMHDTMLSGNKSRQGLPNQSSSYESMCNSLLSLPESERRMTDADESDDHHFRLKSDHGQIHLDTRTCPTTLVNNGIELAKTKIRRKEFLDYYDCDRMCELSPCWFYSGRSQCEIHMSPIRRPMLLFCLQVMDEFIAAHNVQSREAWRVQACMLARTVFVTMWEADVLNQPASQDIVLHDYLSRKAAMMGVSYEVWCIVGKYWDKYKQNYLHHQELYFADTPSDNITTSASRWNQIRNLFHVYGMKPSQALHLTDLNSGVSATGGLPTEKQLLIVAQDFPNFDALRVGLEYLQGLGKRSAKESFRDQEEAPPFHRHVIDQTEWKIAFNTIVINLQKWRKDVQVFPCGSFSRGAAYGSVLDVLVASPENNHAQESHSAFEDVVAALISAKLIDKGSIRPLSAHRGVCVIRYKNVNLLLDLKVYRPPKSWIALLYYIGPENFSWNFFAKLLEAPLHELPEVSFEYIYERAMEVLGLDDISSIESEEDLFKLLDYEYVPPANRI